MLLGVGRAALPGQNSIVIKKQIKISDASNMGKFGSHVTEGLAGIKTNRRVYEKWETTISPQETRSKYFQRKRKMVARKLFLQLNAKLYHRQTISSFTFFATITWLQMSCWSLFCSLKQT